MKRTGVIAFVLFLWKGEGMGRNLIFHIDVNSAFLSWEAVYRQKHLGGTLDLRTVPSAVGGDIHKRHGIILAKSVPAGRLGIRTGESVPEALRKYPGLILVPPHYELYEKNSKAFLEILKEYGPKVEQYSIDEAFMDMTGTEELFGPPVQTAAALKDHIRQELGFTVNVGVSTNKLLAKMAGELRKPDLVHTIFPEEIRDKMWPLPVEELFFVGRATQKKLWKLGIRTIGELAQTDTDILKAHFKKHGEVIHAFANGLDVSVVESQPPPGKGYGNSTTIAFDVCDAGTARLVLLALAETVAARLRRDSVKIRTLQVGIKYFDLSYAGHQSILPQPTDITIEIYETAARLFEELWDGSPIRHLGIHTNGVTEGGEGRQITLFDTVDYEKLGRLDRAVDSIRRRYGADSIMRASFLPLSGGTWGGKPLPDHMEGGISREKLRVDYTQEEVL